MKTLISNSRFILSYLIIVAFFLPSYQNISGFTFIPMAFNFTEEQNEISAVDVFIAIVPLVLIPLSSIAIVVRTYMRRPIRKTFKAVPLICLVMFTGILFLSLRTIEGSGMSSLRTLSHLREGYYLIAVASVFLPFTKSPYRRRMRQTHKEKAEVV